MELSKLLGPPPLLLEELTVDVSAPNPVPATGLVLDLGVDSFLKSEMKTVVKVGVWNVPGWCSRNLILLT